MILLIDVGNTRIKWRYLEKDEFFGGGQQIHQGNLTQELMETLWGELASPESVWVVNVAGTKIAAQISRWATSRWKLEAHFVSSSKHQCNVTNGYNEPERLGADRWMALIGAGRIVQGACCVADCGTAVTVDCMNQNHEHIGGLIIPGLMMMPKCVSDNTAQVTFTQGESALFGRDTSTCLLSGALHSIIGTLQRVAGLMEKRFSSHPTCIITGGDAPLLLPWLDKEWHYEPDLIFIGLAAAIQDNKRVR